MNRTHPWLISALVGLTVLLCLRQVARSEFDAERQIIDGYVADGKFDEAEFYCREQLSLTTLSLERRAAFVVELLRTQILQAAQVSPEQRLSILQNAERDAATYLQRDLDSPQRCLVQFQVALIPRTAAVLRKYETGRAPASMAVWKGLRESKRRLRHLIDEVANYLRNAAGRDPNRPGQLSRRELVRLQARARLELGVTHLEQALAYPDGSDDRILAASEGATEIARLAPTALSVEHWMDSRLAMLTCLRLKGDWTAASRLLKSLSGQRLSPAAQTRLQAELVRIALKRNDWAQVKKMVTFGQPVDDFDDGTWTLALVEGYLALAKRARLTDQPEAASEWERKATELVDEKAARYSRLWFRKVQSLIAAATSELRAGAGQDLRLHAAAAHFRAGRLDQAIVEYEQAAADAQQAGDVHQAFELRRTAAAVELQRSPPAALAKLRGLAVDMPTHQEAARAHLLAVKLAAASEDADYDTLLKEHLQLWPTSGTASWIHWRSAGRAEQAADWGRAAEHYLAVAPDFENYADAIDSAARCCTNELLSQLQNNCFDPSQAERFVDFFLRAAARESVNSSLAADLAAVAAGRLVLKFSGDAASAFATLQNRLESSHGGQPTTLRHANSQAWRTEARFVLAALANRLNDLEGSRRMAASITSQDADQWLELLVELSQHPPVDRERAEFARWLVELTHREAFTQLSGRSARVRDRLLAEALATIGDFGEAARIFQALLTANPRDAEACEGYARMLSTASSPTEPAQVVQAWRETVQHSRPGSPRWFRAKLGIAQAHFRQGDSQRAAEIIKLLQVLHPDLGGSDLRRKFLDLLQQCTADLADGTTTHTD